MGNSPEQDPKQHLTHIFNQAAAVYDDVGPRFFSQYGQRLVELAQISPGTRILDVATGAGALLLPAASAAGPAGLAVGTDLAAQMLARIQKERCRPQARPVRLAQMDGERLAFRPAAFDAVLCGFALFFFPAPRQAVADFYRVLKPGGRLAFTTWGRVENPGWAWMDGLLKAFLPPEPEAEPEPDPERINFRDPDAVYACLQAAGFIADEVITEEREILYRDAADWWAVLNSHAGLDLIETIRAGHGEAGVQRFKAEACEHIRAFQRPDGVPELQKVHYFRARKPGET